jgi:hypothetical protein
MAMSGKKPMTAAERQRPYRERRKAKEQALRSENVRLRLRVKRIMSKFSIETEERRTCR